MKKFLSVLFAFLMATAQAHAYTFSLQDSDDLVNDQTANATQITNNINHFVTGLTQLTGADNITDGSIIGADIAAGTITADKLASGVAGITCYQADASASAVYASATYVDLDTMTITQTFGNSDMTVDFSCEILFTGTMTADFAIVVDGVVKQERSYGVSANYNLPLPISFSWYQTVTSGSHTIKIQTKGNGTYSVEERTLIVEEK